MSVLSQRTRFQQEQQTAHSKRAEWAERHPDSFLNGPTAPTTPSSNRSAPMLSIKLFGRFQASIGEDPLDNKFTGKKNVRMLLVLLAINQGREVSREQLCRVLWPKSDPEVARRNFYTAWSQLKRLLSLPDGTCPYLVRHQYGCSLEQRFVINDMERFSEICRELLFGKPDIERWSLLFTEIDRDFANELMPSDTHNPLVSQARNECRTRLVDALVAATFSIVEEGNAQWGIWFARAAISHDETREDAYIALMKAQIAGNQRTAAMMTFLRCRKVLQNTLGIDPSPEATELYEALLEGERG